MTLAIDATANTMVAKSRENDQMVKFPRGRIMPEYQQPMMKTMLIRLEPFPLRREWLLPHVPLI